MRVFYAVTFDSETKEKLKTIGNLVELSSEKGRFTDYLNYHITIEFIGEVKDEKRLEILKNILENINISPMKLRFNKLGSFNRRNKKIVWLGLEKDKELNRIHNNLKNLLKENNFKVEERLFTPHLTIGRQVVLKEELEEISFKEVKAEVKSIALMESKRINGELVYKPIKEVKP
jgi:2'-5' RNA ligase